MPRLMEGLHRLRLLTPFLRVQRDGRAIAAMARRGETGVWEAAHWQPTHRHDLLEAREHDRVHDPAREHFIARRRLEREVGELRYRSSEYLCSHHQLLLLPVVRLAVPFLSYSPAGEVTGTDVHPVHLRNWQSDVTSARQVVVAVTALEPIYYPSIVGRIRHSGDELVEYDRWVRRLRSRHMLNWLGVDASWIREKAAGLLRQADGLDPLGQWAELVREADPDRWELLRGTARNAVDLRVAAEILLRYYERLVRGRLAAPIKPTTRRRRDELGFRLKRQGNLERALTAFGLSPHPRLILVLEGATELLLFPRVMKSFNVRTDRDFIAIENAEGVARDLSALIAYAVAPSTEREEGRRYLRLLKPPTRLLVMMDAEGPLVTAQDREVRRALWLERIMRTLPKNDQTEAVRDAIGRLVAVETWDRKGQSFEFAHFTDRQLALAMEKVDRRARQPTRDSRIAAIANVRSRRGNLESVLGHASKPDLADAVWPLLERRIRSARQHNSEGRIPIVRALDRAIDLAHEFPRRNLVIPL
jgi:hypothetical protein